VMNGGIAQAGSLVAVHNEPPMGVAAGSGSLVRGNRQIQDDERADARLLNANLICLTKRSFTGFAQVATTSPPVQRPSE
jgi:hypothetical protein